MRVLQYTRLFAATATLALVVLTACGKDNGPSEFNPQGTSSDLSAAEAAMGTGPTESFTAMATDISVVLGPSPALAVAPELGTSVEPTQRFAGTLLRLLPSAGRNPEVMFDILPAEILGTTFEFDPVAEQYVASSRTGAPANGVRFILYAIDPVTRRPASPLNELGFVDVIDLSTATSVALRVVVVSGTVTYLDYSVSASGTSEGGTVTISGFASDGSTRANFVLNTTLSSTASGTQFVIDFNLTVPSRDFAVTYTATFQTQGTGEPTVTLDLTISGPNGTVNLAGTAGSGGGTFTVKVNGDLFATITEGSGDPVITGAGGEPLTPEEASTLREILDYFDDSLITLGDLLAPVA